MAKNIMLNYYKNILNYENAILLTEEMKALWGKCDLNGLSHAFIESFIKDNTDVAELESEVEKLYHKNKTKLRDLIVNNTMYYILTNIACINAYYNKENLISYNTLAKTYLKSYVANYNYDIQSGSGTSNYPNDSADYSADSLFKTYSDKFQKAMRRNNLSDKKSIDNLFVKHILRDAFFSSYIKESNSKLLIKYFSDMCFYILDSSDLIIKDRDKNIDIHNDIRSINYEKLNDSHLTNIVSFYQFVEKRKDSKQGMHGNKTLQLHLLEKIYALNFYLDVIKGDSEQMVKSEIIIRLSTNVKKYGYNDLHRMILKQTFRENYKKNVFNDYEKSSKDFGGNLIINKEYEQGQTNRILNKDEYFKIRPKDYKILINKYLVKGDKSQYRECISSVDKYFNRLSDVVAENILICVMSKIKSIGENVKKGEYVNNLFKYYSELEYNNEIDGDTFTKYGGIRYLHNASARFKIMNNRELFIGAIKDFKDIVKLIDKMFEIKRKLETLGDLQKALKILGKIRNDSSKIAFKKEIIPVINSIKNSHKRILGSNKYTCFINERSDMLDFIESLEPVKRKIESLKIREIIEPALSEIEDVVSRYYEISRLLRKFNTETASNKVVLRKLREKLMKSDNIKEAKLITAFLKRSEALDRLSSFSLSRIKYNDIEPYYYNEFISTYAQDNSRVSNKKRKFLKF